MKIVSLLPSATEIVCRLGLQDSLVGVTHECDYPAGVDHLPKVTQTLIPHDASSRIIDTLVHERLQQQTALYSLNMPVMQQLQPDLIVTQALCDVCAVSEAEVQQAACSLPGAPAVVNLEPMCLSDVLECVRLVGAATECENQAEAEIASLQSRVQAVADRARKLDSHPSVVILEWIDPPFGCGHWSPELVRITGAKELVGCEGEPSQQVAWDTILQADPDILLLACCGFNIERTLVDLPFLRGLPGWDSLSCVRTHQVFAVDGSAYFSRPGPRLVDSLEILAHTIAPQVHPLPDGLPAAVSVL